MKGVVWKTNELKDKILTATVTWRTPLGLMRGKIGLAGVRALQFPPEAEQRLDEAAGAENVTIDEFDMADADATEEEQERLQHLAGEVTEFLRGFFAGETPQGLPELDESVGRPFDRRVWEATRAIAHGQTSTYGEIAVRIGVPGAARAVGGALGRNPRVLLIPCHRVVGSATGARQLRGFTGGLPLKRHLLKLEKRRLFK